MEEKSLKPSRQFIIRGSIAIAIVASILVVQTDWFRALFNKKPLTITPNTTVGDVLGSDTNENGIADWEEKLWGLDPTVLYTNGVPNKQIIENKKKALGATDQNATPTNDTDRLARELYTLTLGLGQSDEIDQKILENISAKIGASVGITAPKMQYSLKDLTTVATSDKSLRAYYTGMTKIVGKYRTDTADIQVVIAALETGDMSRVPELSASAITYSTFSKDMRSLPVPIGLAAYHLALINSVAGIAESMPYLAQLNDNAVASLVGISLYREYSAQLNKAVTQIEDYLTKYGILIS